MNQLQVPRTGFSQGDAVGTAKKDKQKKLSPNELSFSKYRVRDSPKGMPLVPPKRINKKSLVQTN